MPTIWISRRTLVLGLVALVALVAGWVLYPAFTSDAAVLEPAKRVAVALVTGELPTAASKYKDDLAPSAYQLALARADSQTSSSNTPTKRVFEKFGTTIVLDRDFPTPGKATALIQMFARSQPSATPQLYEMQLVMTYDKGKNRWQVERVLDCLEKGEAQK